MDDLLIVRLLRLGRVSLATLTSAAAVAICIGALFGTDQASGWTALQLAACGVVVACGALTWFTAGGWRLPIVLLMSGLGLVALGAAAFVWAVHIGITTADFEYWVMMLDLLLVAQGAMTVLGMYLQARGQRVNAAAPGPAAAPASAT